MLLSVSVGVPASRLFRSFRVAGVLLGAVSLLSSCSSEPAETKIGTPTKGPKTAAATADATAEAPLRVYEEQDGQPVEDPNHRVRMLMVEPNPEQGEAEFLNTVVLVAAMNGYCYVEKVRARSGEIVQLYPRTPDSLKRVIRRDGTTVYEQRSDGRVTRSGARVR